MLHSTDLDTDMADCSDTPPLEERSLISLDEAAELERVFKVLANDTRLRLLHALTRSNELCVTEIAQTLKMKPQAISNQLQRLADQSIVSSRREGNQIYYRILDPCVTILLDRGLCLVESIWRKV